MMPMQNIFAQQIGMPPAPMQVAPASNTMRMPQGGGLQNVFAQRAGMPQAGGSGGMVSPGGIQQGGPPMSGPVGIQGAPTQAQPPMQAQPMQQAQAPVPQPPQNSLRQRLMAY
jgi:hypothetical protein